MDEGEGEAAVVEMQNTAGALRTHVKRREEVEGGSGGRKWREEVEGGSGGRKWREEVEGGRGG